MYIKPKMFSGLKSVLLRLLGVKLLIGLKFIILAQALGPEDFGAYTFVIMITVLSFGLSDLGVTSYFISSKHEKINDGLSLIWTTNIARLVLSLIGLIIFFTNFQTSISFNISTMPLIFTLIALKFLTHPIYNEFQKKLQFSKILYIDLIPALVDLMSVGAFLMISDINLTIALISLCASELTKVILTWSIRDKPKLNISLANIRGAFDYGVWLWLSNSLNILFNWYDKILLSWHFTFYEVGVYYASSRLAQLLVSDVGLAFNQYLFPKLSQHYVCRREKKLIFFGFVFIIIIYGMLVFSFVHLSNGIIITWAYGEKYPQNTYLIKIQILAMIVGVINSFFHSSYKSNQATAHVAIISFVQIMVFGTLTYLNNASLSLTNIAIYHLVSLTSGLLLVLVSKYLANKKNE